MGIELQHSPSKLQGLSAVRAQYQPRIPPALESANVKVLAGDNTTTADPSDRLAVSRAYPHTFGQPLVHLVPVDSKAGKHSPLRVGVAFSGRQSPGGHNIITGLHDALKNHNADSTLLGFIGGTEGIFTQKTVTITNDLLSEFRNQGGYDLLGRTKDQIKSSQQVNDAKTACQALKLDALVLIGGCGSMTDAAQLAESFMESGCTTKVIGVPATIDGDLKNQFVETDVGFDTTCKVYSQLISNICTDALSAEKYYYFIRLMGRQASHVSLECALQSQSNMVLLGEEVANSKLTLFDVTKQICDAIQARGEQGKHHGVILLPEGLIESIPEFYALLQEINGLLRGDEDIRVENISKMLSPWASALFDFLPIFIKKQLLLDRESDGSVQLSQIETEKLLAQLVDTEMTRRTKAGLYKGKKFNAICHFFGYQARGSLPSNFDCNYAYTLGQTAYYLAQAGLTGYLATVANLKQDVSEWRCGGAPLTAMMSVKRWLRGPGVSQIGKPMLHKSKVDLKGKPYELLSQNASTWMMDDLYRNPGPIQFSGPGADLITTTLAVEDNDYIGKVQELYALLDKVKEIVKPGCPGEVLKAALCSMASVTEILKVMSAPPYRGLPTF
jgi:pyrophosphate--fructose-6-phosphate 1-phosphotransferase